MIILGATHDLITSLCPCLARPRLRFVPWPLPLDPIFPPFFLRVNDRTFEVFLCDATSDLEEVDLLLCSDLESSSSSFMETLTVWFAKSEFFTVVSLAVFTRLLLFSLNFLLGLGDSCDASVSASLSFPDLCLEFFWSSSILIVLVLSL